MSGSVLAQADSNVSVIATVEEVVSVIETGFQGPPGPIAVDLPVTNIQYDANSRVTSYERGGVPYTVAYPNANTIILTGGGNTRTVTLDANGRVVSIV